MVTVALTVATLGLSELRLTATPPAGAGDDRNSVSRSCLVVVIALLAGEKVRVPVTCIVWLDEIPPVAVMAAEPKLTPHTFGILCGTDAPDGMKRVSELPFPGPTVTVEESLLVSVMKEPPGAAGVAKVTGNGVHRPGPNMKGSD